MHFSIFRSIKVIIPVVFILALAMSAYAQTSREAQLESMLKESQQMILDLEKKIKLLEIERDSLAEAYKIDVEFERQVSQAKLDAANDKLELRRVFTDSIRSVEKDKYNEMKTFLMNKAKRHWYESPYLWMTVGFFGGIYLDRD